MVRRKKIYKIILNNKEEIHINDYDLYDTHINIEVNNKEIMIPFYSILYIKEL